MKTKFFRYLLPLGLGLSLFVITLIGLTSITLGSCNIEQCTDPDYPLYCSSAEKCCPGDKPYTDGHGSCYGTLEGCTATGYACEHCWEE
ncbi:MAG: hypothetical protein A2X13_06815 [Bacteroidetes bacterium GWC2_33_15]|nr:MAG: hypothetical protein A2X10_02245 [Bacteroidetes bacterium GWA2_33_15]OFX52494.1 MAG: hypothetical protein A2X13_06815 [Bacteroidetes bacterium GWC2_33_15]OFX65555.1 MAG: hypothetical protein A2X15_14930 [Bacteroidetes bacterium GWB2_32_14]OFX67576.1 MAG: hypothetical protein A2X14_11650 [Bacteroidetes bacterium GWD2_33_33]HAN18379.1 hypothetical protein [Bacteroidales bacterium]